MFISFSCYGPTYKNYTQNLGSSKEVVLFMLFRLIGWLSRIDKDAKEARDNRMFDLWLGCYSYEEIAKIVDSSPTEAKRVVSSETAELPNRTKPASEHLTDFDPPLYNIWKQQKKPAAEKIWIKISRGSRCCSDHALSNTKF